MNAAERLRATTAVLFGLPLALASCSPREEVAAPPPVRPVRTITVAASAQTQPLSFPARIEAADQADIGFRIAGRLSERLVGVGATVTEGQVLARLDPETEINELRSARAGLAAAESASRQAQSRFERLSHLHGRGITSLADLEAAEQAAKAARSQAEAAAALVRVAEDVVGFTTLTADAPAVVTFVGAEPGEVVAAGRPVFRLARRDGRDAVLDVPAGALDAMPAGAVVTVSLPGDASVTARGRVREVSPQADDVTRLFRVRVGLSEVPSAMRLGTAVQAAFASPASAGVTLPASAVVPGGAGSAVWVVDPASRTLTSRTVEISGGDPASVVVSKGISPGDVVVTAGVSSLAAGQKVRLAGIEP